METSDVISAVALAVSLATFYWAGLRGPRFHCAPIRFLEFARPPSGNSLILLSVVISNSGARIGVIDYLYLRLCPLVNRDIAHRFWEFLEPPDAAPRLVLPETLQDLPSAFAIQPGESVKKMFYFKSEDPEHDFVVGEHELKLWAVAAGRQRHVKLQHQRVEVQDPIARGKYVIGGSLHKVEMIRMGPPHEGADA
jgi:hypothetical protein